MNERKSFQAKCNINEKNIFNNNINRKNKKQTGITLIALVISIIVMLILAGVSLNATIGDNGIITQAKNATYMQSIAALEEYLQTEYVKYYDETENYTSKIELLSSKLGNLCLKDGTKNYITYDGKMYYLINKQALPDDVKNQLKGGDTTEYLKYIRLQDVYGVTPDLKVYYCESGTDSALGTLDSTELDPNTPLKKINQDAEMKSAITEALGGPSEVGENGITVGDAAKIKNLELDGSKHNITSISGLSELSSLKTVTLSNLNLNDLDGLQNCTLLYYVYFKNCKVKDYSKLATVLELQYLYLYLPPSMSEKDANAQVVNLGNGLANATELNKLEYFGIFGETDILKREEKYDYSWNNGLYAYSSNTKNNLTDISKLSMITSNIKSSIKTIYMNNNQINNLNALEKFSNIEELDIMNNNNLKNMKGLENHVKMKYIIAPNTGIESVEELSGCDNIEVAIFSDSKLRNIKGLKSENLKLLDLKNSKITNIDDLTNNSNLTYLQLENNIALVDISSIKICNKIDNLYLAGNTILNESVLSSLEFQNIIKQCGVNYSLDGKYGLLFLNQEKVDLENANLTDGQLELLRGKTSIKGIKLTGNPNLSNEKIEEILGTLTNLECVSLYKVSQVISINFVNNLNNLVELDLRGTNVNDLSVLENLTNNNKLKIGCLILDKGDVSSIQNTISEVSRRHTSSKYEFNKVETGKSTGFIYTNKEGLNNFAKCTNITYFWAYSTMGVNVDNAVIDLSNCFNLEKVLTRAYNVKFYLPKTLKTYECENPNTPNLKGNLDLQNFTSTWSGAEIDINQVLEDLSSNENLQTFNVSNSAVSSKGTEIISNLHYLKNKPVSKLNLNELANLKKIDLQENLNNIKYLNLYGCINYEDVSTFNNFTNLEILNLHKTKVKSLDGIKTNIHLKNLNIDSTLISSLEPLINLNNMEILKCSNAKISSLKGIENMVNMTDLDVSNNSISNLYYLSNLFDKGNIKLNSLNLTNNLLENNAIMIIDGNVKTINNVEIIKKLYNAGLRNIDISGNNFMDTSEIKSLKWNSYKE